MRIGIIGGGAAGLVSAITSKNDTNEVIILERNNECGKKILMTGNGRCNYWNEDQSINHYESSNNFIEELINKDTENKVMDFFNELRIFPKIKNGYYYPNSNQALTIRNMLVNECIDRGVIIRNNYLVESIDRINNKFIINGELEFDKIVISCGSCASPKTGSTGMGYIFLQRFGHNIIKPIPALVQLITKKYSFLNTWKGVRCDVMVSQIEDGELVSVETGEIQLTDYGISGICVFNLSNGIARGLDNNAHEVVEIDFLKELSEEELYNRLNYKDINKVLYGLLNTKLVDIILSNSKNIDEIVNNIKHFRVEIIGTKDFSDAQVASGGVSLDEINLSTMESKLVNNLYVVGELLDLTGECGGYNLGIAWRSGIVCGEALRGDLSD